MCGLCQACLPQQGSISWGKVKVIFGFSYDSSLSFKGHMESRIIDTHL
jgi:hypothetical protein